LVLGAPRSKILLHLRICTHHSIGVCAEVGENTILKLMLLGHSVHLIALPTRDVSTNLVIVYIIIDVVYEELLTASAVLAVASFIAPLLHVLPLTLIILLVLVIGSI
jgi:hypothetical protein